MLAERNQLLAALAALENIPRPTAYSQGEHINSSVVYRQLTKEQQAAVDTAEALAYEAARERGVERLIPNKKTIRIVTSGGFPTVLNYDQCDPMKLVGKVQIGEVWTLDISDRDNTFPTRPG